MKVKVTTSRGLHVRAERSTRKAPLRVLPFGATVELESADADWGKIGKGEFIMMKFVEALEEEEVVEEHGGNE